MESLAKVTPDLLEILVVDDNSQDGTPQLVEEYADAHPNFPVRLIRRPANPGLTNSLWDGIQAAKGTIVTWMDCDFSMPPELVPDLVRLVEGSSHIAVGSRFVPGGSFKRGTAGTQDSWTAVALSRLMNYTIQFFLDHRFKDYTSGFIAARKEIFDRIKLQGDYGEYFIDLIFRALRLGFTVTEIPYICTPRLRGYSKTGQHLGQYLQRGWKYVVVAVKLRLLASLPGSSLRRT